MQARSSSSRYWLASEPVEALRVAFITFIALITSAARAEPSEAEYPEVVPGRALTFPADEGSHPAYRTEWWYITGWLRDAEQRSLGFQVTFFRSRPGVDEANPSSFAPKQLLFAHAAISDPSRGELLRAERSARAGFGLAVAAEQKLDVRIDNWTLRKGGDVYRATIAAGDIAFDLEFRATQPPLLQGRNGFSQKGPDPRSASYYYSLPQMSARGRAMIDGRERTVEGVAWFDHEWSSTIMDEAAAGWDWAGINLDDGSAVMAFQMRDQSGDEHWAAATWRPHFDSLTSTPRTFSPDEIEWQPLRTWKSPRTGVTYPIEWRVTLGERTLTLKPLMDDQENDARGSTGTLYWEGAVRAYEDGQPIGRGYLELTGYGKGSAARM